MANSVTKVRTPLYENGRNFKVGDPVNGRVGYPHEGPDAQCRCSEWRYDGSDPRLRWPEGWHVHPRDGTIGNGLAGDFHVDCAHMAPDRLSVRRDADKQRNVLLLQGGTAARPGKCYVAHWFDANGTPRDIYHGDNIAVEVDLVFMLLPDGDTQHHGNVELRGMLNAEVFKNEANLCLGLYFGKGMLVSYWLNAHDESTTGDARKTYHESFPLLKLRWYHLTLRLEPIPTQPDTWAASITLRQPQQIVWQWASAEGAHPNNIKFISQVGGGDERGRDDLGGPFLIRRFETYAVSQLEGDQP